MGTGVSICGLHLGVLDALPQGFEVGGFEQLIDVIFSGHWQSPGGGFLSLKRCQGVIEKSSKRKLAVGDHTE